MAMHEIISQIDAYLSRLHLARDILVKSLPAPPAKRRLKTSTFQKLLHMSRGSWIRSVGKWREGAVRMVLGCGLDRRVRMSGRAVLCELSGPVVYLGCGYELHSELVSFALQGG